MSGGSRVRALLDDALLYLRSCENLTAPAIEHVSGGDRVASIETCASIDCDRLLDDAPQLRVLQVREVFTSPMPPPLTLQRPHPNIEGLIAFRPVTAQAIAMLPGLRFLKVHRSFPQLGPAVSPEVQLALPEASRRSGPRISTSPICGASRGCASCRPRCPPGTPPSAARSPG